MYSDISTNSNSFNFCLILISVSSSFPKFAHRCIDKRIILQITSNAFLLVILLLNDTFITRFNIKYNKSLLFFDIVSLL